MAAHSVDIAIRDNPMYIEADTDNRKVVHSQARTDIAYYKFDQSVSASSYDGILPVDGSVELLKGAWFVSPTKARVRVEPQPPVQEQRRFNSMLMWGHSWTAGAAGGDYPFTLHPAKVAVNLLGCERIESRSVGGTTWTGNRLRDGVVATVRAQGSSWVDMFRYCHTRLQNWPVNSTSGADASAYLFLHGQNEFHHFGTGRTAPFVNTARAGIHLALARNAWIQSSNTDTPFGGDGDYFEHISGTAPSVEAKTDRNTGADTLAFTGDSVERINLPNWGSLAGVGYEPNEGANADERTVGITFIIDPATDGTVTVTNNRTGDVVGPVQLDAATNCRPTNATYPTSLPLPHVVRVAGCRPLDQLEITITDVTGKVQIDAAGIEARPYDQGSPLVIWEVQPTVDNYNSYQAPYATSDAVFLEFARATKLMLQEFPAQLVKMVDHENCHLTATQTGVAHPDGLGHDRMTLNIRDVVAPGMSDYNALRAVGGDDEWRSFTATDDDYDDITQANVFDIIPPAGYRKRLDGTIELRGVMGRDAACVANDVIAVLPQGFRPRAVWTHLDIQVGHIGNDFGIARVRIEAATGEITYAAHIAGTVEAFPQFYFDGVLFDGQL